MPAAPDGPVPDTRIPGYGCTYSLGPLGPSRVLLQWSAGVIPDGSLLGGVVLPWESDDWSLPGNGSVWIGYTPGAYYTLDLRLDDPDTGRWAMSLLVEPEGGGDEIFYAAEFTNFRWSAAAVTLASLIDDNDRTTARRLPEWFKVSAVYPEATLAERP